MAKTTKVGWEAKTEKKKRLVRKRAWLGGTDGMRGCRMPVARRLKKNVSGGENIY